MSFSPSGGDRRISPRAIVHAQVTSSLGRVVDLSSTGVRISCLRAPSGDVIPVEIGDEHGAFCCAGRIAWSRRCGLFRHEIGLLFPPLDEASAETLRRLIATHRFSCDYGEAA